MGDAPAIAETTVVALTMFFATIGPLDGALIFAALTARATPQAKRSMALRGTAIATVILLFFAVFGELLLRRLGISLAALRASGGILLLLIGIDMAFARDTGGTSTTQEENREAASRQDLAVFPLATPLIAGPGAMGAAMLLMADTGGHWLLQASVIFSLLAMLVFTLAMLLMATKLQQLLGFTGLHAITRIFGVLLAALAVQFIFDGVAQSGLL